MTIDEFERAPAGVDPSIPSIARVYDAFLGGKDNYEVDREVFRGVQQEAPEAQDLALENRAFLIRACRFLATQTDLDQYLDLGSGLPTAENTHQVVQRIKPSARVVYVDNDPVVLAHGRALLEENESTHFVSADIFETAEILADDAIRKHIDFSEPLVLLHLATIHHFNGTTDEAAEIVKDYVDALPSGSYVVFSHFLDPENEHSTVARKMEEVFRNSPMGSGTFRTLPEIKRIFGGLEILEPGVVRAADWWPDGPRVKPLNQVQHCLAGGVGRKA